MLPWNDPEAVTDEFFAFVIDPRPTRNDRPMVEELHDIAPQIIPILEHMVLDGVDERHDVADFVHAILSR